MKLYLVHCGYYDNEIGGGLYESHVNYFVAALDFDEARSKVKLIEEFQRKKMHVDGLQEIEAVDGHRVKLDFDQNLNFETSIRSHKHRDLAPKKVVESLKNT